MLSQILKLGTYKNIRQLGFATLHKFLKYLQETKSQTWTIVVCNKESTLAGQLLREWWVSQIFVNETITYWSKQTFPVDPFETKFNLTLLSFSATVCCILLKCSMSQAISIRSISFAVRLSLLNESNVMSFRIFCPFPQFKTLLCSPSPNQLQKTY